MEIYDRDVSPEGSPFTIVVSGIPGAGKSTVGRALADRLDAVFLDKDDYLEALFEIDRAPRDLLSRRADESFLDAVASERRAVAVSFWRRPEMSTTSGTPTDRLPHDRAVIEIWCDCPAEVAHRRFFSRTRHHAHGDEQRDRSTTLTQLRRLSELGPLGIERVLRVDTTEQPDIDDLVDRLGFGRRSESVR